VYTRRTSQFRQGIPRAHVHSHTDEHGPNRFRVKWKKITNDADKRTEGVWKVFLRGAARIIRPIYYCTYIRVYTKRHLVHANATRRVRVERCKQQRLTCRRVSRTCYCRTIIRTRYISSTCTRRALFACFIEIIGKRPENRKTYYWFFDRFGQIIVIDHLLYKRRKCTYYGQCRPASNANKT